VALEAAGEAHSDRAERLLRLVAQSLAEAFERVLERLERLDRVAIVEVAQLVRPVEKGTLRIEQWIVGAAIAIYFRYQSAIRTRIRR
jgi:hypothetical protein